MFKVTVINDTDERKEPDIRAEKTGARFTSGTTWLTETIYKVRPGETWITTPSGNWTAVEYPVNNNYLNIKTYITYVEIPSEPTYEYDPNDKLIHEVNGVVVAEYHRWIK